MTVQSVATVKESAKARSTTRRSAAKRGAASIDVTLKFEREAKNSVRYVAEGDDPLIVGPLYFRKSAAACLGDPWPDSITVVVTAS